MNGASAKPPSVSVIFRSATASGVWLFATVCLGIIWFALVLLETAHSSRQWHPTPAYILVALGYLLLGCVLVYWVWRKERINLP